MKVVVVIFKYFHEIHSCNTLKKGILMRLFILVMPIEKSFKSLLTISSWLQRVSFIEHPQYFSINSTPIIVYILASVAIFSFPGVELHTRRQIQTSHNEKNTHIQTFGSCYVSYIGSHTHILVPILAWNYHISELWVHVRTLNLVV